MNQKKNKYSHIKKGIREDVGPYFFRSAWEADFGRFLNLLVAWDVIVGWEYEPQGFSFQGFGYKRGPFIYYPDFAVLYSKNIDQVYLDLLEPILDVRPGEVVYLEVKGQEKGSDRSKWRRFRKHTGNKLDIIKKDKMYLIQAGFKDFIPNWESRVRN